MATVGSEGLAGLTTLGERVRELRNRRGWSQTEYAKKTGLTQNYVNQLENGRLRAIPKQTTLQLLARPLYVTVGELTGERPLPARETPYETNADIRAIADALVTRPEAAFAFAQLLRALGHVATDDNVLEFVPAATEKPREMSQDRVREIADALGDIVEFRKGSLWKEYEVPLVGTVSAGSGIEMFETYEKVRQIPEYYWRAGARAVFKAKGHSMMDMGITDSDLLFVRPTQRAKSGEVVVCSLNGSAFVKEFDRSREGVRLLSHNPEYQPIVVGEQDELRIFGVVVGRTGDLGGERLRSRGRGRKG